MIKTTLGWIADVVDGTLSTQSVEEYVVESIGTDTRSLSTNALFFAIVGENFDGHDYTLQALQKGACALVISKLVETPLPTILVDDTKTALGKLGAAVKARINPKTIGITGSSGKTTVKEMCASILSIAGKTHATKGNYNNDIGVPLTLLDLEDDDEFSVVEMGANHQGEIAYTTALVKPDVATIVNAAPSHLEGFGSLLGVAKAKNEIFSGLGTTGTAIINADSQFYDYWVRKNTHLEFITFSPESEKGSFHAINRSINAEGCAEFELITPKGKAPIRLCVPGAHNVGNAVLAAALTSQVGASLEQIQDGLFKMRSVKGRLTVVSVSPVVKLLDDTYNANVASTKAAIDSLNAFNGTKVFVFGDMCELGVQAEFFHEEIGEYAKTSGIDYLFTTGELSKRASAKMLDNGMHLDSADEILKQIEVLFTRLSDEKKLPLHILVKGSRSSKMERVSEKIISSDMLKSADVKSPSEDKPC
ncbi:MAG: UDP-N-acetylmuramoyl-tripeptide--D-alanyl-D-alanine ligase [Pseudomonadota bacterium]